MSDNEETQTNVETQTNIENRINEESQTDEFNNERDSMSLVDHLQELRRRLITMVIAVVITSIGCFFYAEDLVKMITVPAGKLYYMNPAEAFFSYMKISVFAGFLVALPVVMHQLWAFVLPALTKNERQAGIFLVPASLALFFIGLIFSYTLVLPVGIKFFMGFATDELQPLFSLGQYLSFVISFLLPFGFVFELPLVILVMAKVGLIKSEYLQAKRKIVLLLSFIVGAIISPTPDVFSQTMIAVPILVLYEVSILMVKHVLRK